MTGTATAPADLLDPVRRRVDRALERQLDHALEGVGEAAVEAVRYAALGSGKRVRPLLLLAARRAAGAGMDEGAVELACSVEFVHAYSLVHDDLPCMDDDVLRRGRPAHHVRYAPTVSVLAGAILMPVAVASVEEGGRRLELPEPVIRDLAGELLRAAGASGMVGGQLLDLEAEGSRPAPEAVEEIYRGKTAALIAAAIRMGGISAGAGEDRSSRLSRFGWRLGLAFQIVDDLLDVQGSDRELGKESGRDAALEKATYPAIAGVEVAERRSSELAAAALEELEPMGEAADLLRSLAGFVVQRRR